MRKSLIVASTVLLSFAALSTTTNIVSTSSTSTGAGSASTDAPTASTATVWYGLCPKAHRNSVQAIREAIAGSPVAAARHAAFDWSKARTLTAPYAFRVHADYTVGGKVFWARNKVVVVNGETLITDGNTVIRGQCCNTIKSNLEEGDKVLVPEPDISGRAVPFAGSEAHLDELPAEFPVSFGAESQRPPGTANAAEVLWPPSKFAWTAVVTGKLCVRVKRDVPSDAEGTEEVPCK